MNKICPNCSAEYKGDQKFCSQCGFVLNSNVDQASQPTASPNKPGKKKPLIIGVCCALVLVVLAVFLLTNNVFVTDPFMGISLGDTILTVQNKLGNPDINSDHGYDEFDYYYNTSFLGMEGQLNIHFATEDSYCESKITDVEVDALTFAYSNSNQMKNDVLKQYRKVVKHFSGKYGDSVITQENESGSKVVLGDAWYIQKPSGTGLPLGRYDAIVVIAECGKQVGELRIFKVKMDSDKNIYW